MTYADLHITPRPGRGPRSASGVLVLFLLTTGCSIISGQPVTGEGFIPASARPPDTAIQSPPIQVPIQQAAVQEPKEPLTGARAFLDEAVALLDEADAQFASDDFESTEASIKETLQVLLEADELLPSRADLADVDPATDEGLLRHEALTHMRDEFDALWTRANALYDSLLPYLDAPGEEAAQPPSEERVDLEAMNEAVEEGSVEPAPASWQAVRDLLIQMDSEGRIGVPMGLEDYPESAWRTPIYRALSYYLGRGRKNFTIWLERAGRYRDLVEDILEEEGLPRDMVYLCMIESGFSPRAYSRAAATGPWQFMWYTGEKYGLTTYKKSDFIDERRDFEKSTRAAVAYLKDLYAEFGTWPLAMAAYNSGEGRVRGAQRWAKRTRHDLGYWGIYDRLPRETRNYVPYYLAALLISKNPARFGFTDVVAQESFTSLYETVHVEGALTLEMAADFTGASEALLRELNPELHSLVTPREGYDLRIPVGTTDAFIAALEALPEQGRVSYLSHTVQRGQTGGAISERYGVPWTEIKTANKIRDDRSLQVGQVLRIPKRESSRYLTDGEIASMVRSRSVSGSGTPVYYRVRRGDTISGIATAHGVTWMEIRSWNGLRGNTIFAGQSLKLYPRGSRVAAQPAVATANLPADGVYTIGKNDTLWDIAQRFSVSVADLKTWNRLSGNTIYPGRRLIVTRQAADAAGTGAGSGTY